jgi:hypothetical protein
MANSAKKPGGKFRGLGVLFIILGILFIIPALPLSIFGGMFTLESYGFKNELTALPAFNVVEADLFYTADFSTALKYGEGNYTMEEMSIDTPSHYYYIEARNLANETLFLPVEIFLPESISSAALIDTANRGLATLPEGIKLKVTGRMMPISDAQRTALYDNMLTAGIVTDETEFNEKVLPFMLAEFPIDGIMVVTIVGAALLVFAILFFILSGVMFKKRRALIEEAEIQEAKKMDLTKIKQPNSEKFFSSEDDIDNLVVVTPSAKKDEKDDGTYKPKLPTPTAQSAPDELDLSNLDFSSLKPPEEDDPLF